MQRYAKAINEKLEQSLRKERSKAESLEKRTGMFENKSVLLEKLKYKIDEMEKYSWCTSLRFDYIDLPANGTRRSCKAIVLDVRLWHWIGVC